MIGVYYHTLLFAIIRLTVNVILTLFLLQKNANKIGEVCEASKHPKEVPDISKIQNFPVSFNFLKHNELHYC